jgi:anaerobic magnesium-protoporphyrin IX monomethyl ester cyclase
MKYLLIFPPTQYYSISKTSSLSVPTVPPLGLLYLARALENIKNEVEVIDFNSEEVNFEKLKKAVDNADFIGISILTISIQKAKELIQQIREIDPKKPIIIGGPHCSLYPERTLLETDANICVEGEGEHTICDISKSFEGKKPLLEIQGIYYKNEKNEIKKGPPPILIKDIDKILFPSHHLVKKYRYGRIINPKLQGGKFTSIITSRGCPHRCRYCTRHFFGMSTCRFRSVQNVIEELKDLQIKGYKYLFIADDSFLSNPTRAYQIMDEVIKEKLHFDFFIQGVRVDSVDEKLYKKLKDAGVKAIGFGLESGNQDVLDFYNKNITVDQIRKAVTICRKTGIFTFGSFILGAPFETKEHFKNTIKFAYSLPLDSVTFYPLEYRAGSDLWIEAVKEGKIKPEEYVVISDSNRGLGIYPKDEIIRYCKKAQRTFHFRPTHLIDEFILACIKKDFTFIKAGFNFFKLI